MRKMKAILFVGLALTSFNAFGQGLFDDMSSDAASKPLYASRLEDNGFLTEVERMQKDIRLMQLELTEKELQYRVEEQKQKFEDLKNPPVEEEKACDPVPQANSNDVFNSFMPTSVAAAPVPEMIEIEEAPAVLEVTSIKGMEGRLRATVYSDDLGVSIVGNGDVLNNGFIVKNVSKNTVTFENTDGDIEVIGLTFRR